ncbi:MAG: hypothetical protein D6679_14600 [Candidatus Hydrogenedentota bacterium]|nr:MAG: hypothetical protein D6679_14600 [Candidatus Hydrogenedentota bacterium]
MPCLRPRSIPAGKMPALLGSHSIPLFPFPFFPFSLFPFSLFPFAFCILPSVFSIPFCLPYSLVLQ